MAVSLVAALLAGLIDESMFLCVFKEFAITIWKPAVLNRLGELFYLQFRLRSSGASSGRI